MKNEFLWKRTQKFMLYVSRGQWLRRAETVVGRDDVVL